MLGQWLQSLDNPQVASGILASLDDPALARRLSAAAATHHRPPADVMATAVHGFLDTASDDHWVQLIGIMNRAGDPGLAAIRAILDKCLPQETEA